MVQGTLEAYGIYVLPEKKDVDDASNYEGNEVIDQSVKAGEKVSAGDTVILYIPNIVVNRCRVKGMKQEVCAKKVRWIRKAS